MEVKSCAYNAIAIAITSAVIASVPAAAQAQVNERSFDIPAQPMSKALSVLAKQSGLQIVSPGDDLRVPSKPIKGRMDVRVALREMIRDSGLEIASDEGGVVILRRAQARSEAGNVASGGDLADSSDIIVSGSRPIAESEEAALRVQRNSPALVSVIASDAVGRLPDQNVAQAVSRLPGVAIARDQGQARYVNLRGAPVHWTTMAFDGVNVISPGGRKTLFDTIPSAIAGQIIVRKAVTPDMTGETIAGSIDITTRSAFDFKGFHIAGKLGGGVNDMGGGDEREANLVISDRFDTGIGEIGVLVAGSYYDRDFVVNNFEGNWAEAPRDQRPGHEDRIWNREATNKLYHLSRGNRSVSGRLDWKPSPGHRLFASSIYTAFVETESRSRFLFDFDDQAPLLPNAAAGCAVSARPAPGTTGYADICAGNTPTRGTVYGIDLTANATYKDAKQSIFTNTIGGDHELSDWTVSWRGNYTRSLDDRSIPMNADYLSPGFGTGGSGAVNRPSVVYDLSDPSRQKLEVYRTIRNADGTFSLGERIGNFTDLPMGLTRLRSLDAQDLTKSYTGRLDVSKAVSLFGADAVITVGGRYDDRTKTALERELVLGSTAAFAAAGIGTDYSLLAGKPYNGSLKLGYEFDHFSVDKFKDVLEKMKANGNFVDIPGNYYQVKEKVLAGYGMIRGDFDGGDFVAGARVEHIRNSGKAFARINGTSELVTSSSSDTLFYPSAHLNLDVADDKKIRMSFTTGAARADYDVLRPNYTISDAGLSISGGNPEAKPERAKGVDLYFEWYTRPTGFISAGVFYKDVSDVLFSSTTIFGSHALDSGGIDRSQYSYSAMLNGGKGHIAGAEAAFQQQLEPFLATLGLPEWAGGFGVQANVTYNDSEATTPDGRKVAFPGTSKWVYNIGGYYEKYGFSLRLNYQNRSSYIDEIGDAADGGDIMWAPDDELDFSARVSATRNVEFYFDAANLLNTANRRYVGRADRTIQYAKFGRRFVGGVRVNF